MKVLVAGGAGYIGGVTSRLLQESGHDVVVFDDLSTGYQHNLGDTTLVEGSLVDEDDVSRLFRAYEFEVVMNFAAKIRVEESMENPHLYFRNNLYGMLNLIAAATGKGVGGLVFSSTAAVYGEPREVPISEDSPTEPINPYGMSKLMVERALASYQVTHGLNWVAFRYFNAGGAYSGVGEEHPVESHLVPLAIRAMKAGKKLQVYGDDYDTKDGTCVRDYVHVYDIARAHVTAAELMAAGKVLQQPVNLGSGDGFSVLDVIKTLEEVAGRAVAYDRAARRAGDPPTLVASNARADELLEWKPEKSLHDVITDALAFDEKK